MKRESIDAAVNGVEKACDKYGFDCHVAANGIFIRTKALAGWLIRLDDDKPRLFHENYRHLNRYGNGIMERYHEHTDMREDTAEGFVEYIYAHDKYAFVGKKKKYYSKK